jgi:hypothetical protein
MPVAAGLAMCMPVPLWDLALERELAQAAIRKACREAGVHADDGDVAACHDAIFKALTSGHKPAWLLNSTFVASYIGGLVALPALVAASTSWVVTRIVEQHLRQHATLDGLTAEVARASFLSLLRQWPHLRNPSAQPTA